MQIGDAMTRRVETIGPEATVRQAAEQMRSLGIGALPVTEAGRLVGMITDRDITVRATAAGLDPNVATVGETMTRGVVTARASDPLIAAERLMEEKAVRRLVVLDQFNQLAGIFTLDDLAVVPGEARSTGEILQQLNTPS